MHCENYMKVGLYQASRHFSIRHQASSHFFPQRLGLGLELAASLMGDRKWWLAWLQLKVYASQASLDGNQMKKTFPK